MSLKIVRAHELKKIMMNMDTIIYNTAILHKQFMNHQFRFHSDFEVQEVQSLKMYSQQRSEQLTLCLCIMEIFTKEQLQGIH